MEGAENLESRKYQRQFMDLLKNSVPAHIKLAEEISQLLNISADSAYRRIRCETDISISEAVEICKFFDLPLDRIIPEGSSAVTFQINRFNNEFASFENYLNNLIHDLEFITRFEDGEVYYAAEDLPVFYNFYFPKLAKFKIAYWMKSIQNSEDLQGLKIEDIELPESFHPKAMRIGELFLKLKSTDLWHEDTIKSVLRQISFYWDAGFFREKQTVLDVLDELENLIDMVEIQATAGKKIIYSKKQHTGSEYVFYISDLMIGNNCVILKAGERVTTYLGYNTFNFMHTNGHIFNEQASEWMQNLISKSTLVSQVGEKIRNQFFRQNFQFIADLRTQILAD